MTDHPALWRNRRYVLWLVSDTAKGLATTLAAFAVPLIALAVTDDPAQAGIIGGVGLVIRLVVTLYGGVLADRHDRIVLMIVGAVVASALAAGFTLLALSDALAFGTLVAVESLLMVRAGLFEPASESAIKQIVPDEAMGRAQAANQGRDAALQLAGGPLGGLLLGVGAWLIGAAMTAGYAVAGITAGMLRRRAASDPARSGASGSAARTETTDQTDAARRVAGRHAVAGAERPEPPTPNALAEIRAGFAFLFSRPDMGGVLLIVTIINLGFNAALTTVIYALQQSGHSELLIGTMSAAIGAVMLVGALAAPTLVPRIGGGILTIAGLCLSTAAAVAVSFVTDPWWIIVVIGCAVLLLPALNASLLGYFMVATPTELLGRANAAAGVLGMGAMPFGPLIAGFGLSLVGRQGTILFCAAICAISATLAIASRPLRAIPAEAGWSAHAAQFERTPPAG